MPLCRSCPEKRFLQLLQLFFYGLFTDCDKLRSYFELDLTDICKLWISRIDLLQVKEPRFAAGKFNLRVKVSGFVLVWLCKIPSVPPVVEGGFGSQQ